MNKRQRNKRRKQLDRQLQDFRAAFKALCIGIADYYNRPAPLSELLNQVAMNKDSNEEEGKASPAIQPDHDDPDMEYVQAVSTDEFTKRIEDE